MAKAKTASFYIRRKVNCNGTTPDVVTLDTSVYVDPSDRQGLMIESVDFVFYNSGNNMPLDSTNDESVAVQMCAGAKSQLIAYDSEDLIASAGLVIDGNSGSYNATDVYPDVLGSRDGRIVVDDEISIVGRANSALTNGTCALIIKAKVVTLTNKDYMALALQTVAN